MAKTNKELTVEFAGAFLSRTVGLEDLNDMTPDDLEALLRKIYYAIRELPDD